MKNKYRILVIEDEKNIRMFLAAILEANDYQVLFAQNGESAYSQIFSFCPDLILLDLGLPDMDGQRIIRDVRRWSTVPILVVSARSQEQDKIAALDLGANDYITKPFSTGELVARVRAALRVSRINNDNPQALSGRFYTGDLIVDYDKRRVYVGQRDVQLTQTEFNIVSLLSLHAGKVLTHDFIIKKIWGPNMGGDNKILRVNMANIRRKLGGSISQPKYIFTEMGVGYRMSDASAT